MEIEDLKTRLLSMKPEKISELKAKLGPELFKKTFFGKSSEINKHILPKVNLLKF